MAFAQNVPDICVPANGLFSIDAVLLKDPKVWSEIGFAPTLLPKLWRVKRPCFSQVLAPMFLAVLNTSAPACIANLTANLTSFITCCFFPGEHCSCCHTA